MPENSIIIINPDSESRDQIAKTVAGLGHKPMNAGSGKEGLQLILDEEAQIVLCDLNLPDTAGLNILQESLKANPDIAFILITSEGTLDSALQARRLGAYDYLARPFQPGELENAVQRASERTKLLYENRLLKEEIGLRYDFSRIIGKSRPIQEIISLIKKVSLTKSTVLITGESGTGKELVAKAIHYNSRRASKPLVVVNCGAIPENLLESEMFGYRKGAFTGATGNRRGLFEESNGGTLFLDEIGELPLQLQPKILRAIQEEEIRPLGGNESIKLDLRIIVATNKNLEEEVAAGRFREELYYRLNVFNIHIPPLRERPDDIEPLVHHIWRNLCQQNNRTFREISPNAMVMLKNFPWPGNVREIENALEQSLLLLDERKIFLEEEDLPLFLEQRISERKRRFIRDSLGHALSLDEYTKVFIQTFEKDYPDTEIARMLGINPKTLWEKRKKWGLVKKRKVRSAPATQDQSQPVDSPEA
ncbi:MAG: sigma-54 dependent transcriptional regulator [Proteobacteria bacterium]|nr:sigma-54 dependent transcriptional regulator [Pseudomonadota bacterium]